MLSVIYSTNRKNPRIEWFFDSLWRECQGNPDGIEVVVVDYHVWYEKEQRIKEIEEKAKGRFPALQIIPPKPTVWQGPHKLTKENYFAASNSRNTAIAYARGHYLAFVDDLSVLMPGWLDQVRHAMHHGYVIAGMYRKVLKLEVENGDVISFEDHPSGWDSRWNFAPDTGIVSVNSDLLYGCSFGGPLEAFLKINGCDEICDSMGFEDVLMSMRLARAGYPIFLSKKMLTYESEEAHGEEKPFIRVIKPMGKTDSSHVLLNKLKREKRRITADGNIYSLRELRLLAEHGKPMPIPKDPKKHWPDGQLLREMP